MKILSLTIACIAFCVGCRGSQRPEVNITNQVPTENGSSEIGRFQVVHIKDNNPLFKAVLLDTKTGDTWNLEWEKHEKHGDLPNWEKIEKFNHTPHEFDELERKLKEGSKEFNSIWNSAYSAMTKKHEDFEKLSEQIYAKMSKKKKTVDAFGAIMLLYADDPTASIKFMENLLEDAYQEVLRDRKQP